MRQGQTERWLRAGALGLVVLGAGPAFTMMTGCRTVGGWVGSKDAEARSGTVWNVPAPDIPPPALDRRTAYVSVRNMSDAQDIDIAADVKSAVQEAGYTLVADPTQANYRLRATIRYFGENEAADEGRGLANSLGAIGGAATGITAGVGTGYLLSSAGANNSIAYGGGAAAGVGAGGLVGVAIANRMKAREWNLIIDLVLEEKLDQPVTFTVANDTGRSSDTGASNTMGRAGVQGQTVSGGERSGQRTTGQMERTSDYFPHGMRLTGWARQIGMQEAEAVPLLKNRVRQILPKVMPE